MNAICILSKTEHIQSKAEISQSWRPAYRPAHFTANAAPAWHSAYTAHAWHAVPVVRLWICPTLQDLSDLRIAICRNAIASQNRVQKARF